MILLSILLNLLLYRGHSKNINITVYRITPRNYTGLTNFDSGSPGGDTFFGIYELQAPLVCTNKQSSHYNLLCQNQPILQIPGFNVYTRTIVEMDARFGDYSECNPDKTTGIFSCQHFHGMNPHDPPVCWFNNSDNPSWKTEFASECDQSVCQCDAVEKKSVGREVIGSSFGGGYLKKWPQQCLDNFYLVEDYLYGGKPAKTLTNVDEGECCSACAFEKRLFISGCGGYTWSSKNKTCKLYNRFVKPSVPAPKSKNGTIIRSGYNLRGTPYWSILGSTTQQIADILNGSWYSTRSEGECAKGERPNGDGKCWWRIVKQTSNVNASCVNNNLVKVIQASNPTCFENCGADSKNLSSVCFIRCLFETAAGNQTKGWPAMKRDVLLKAFEGSFDSDNMDFGCPQVPPCPDPCNPPAMALTPPVITQFDKSEEESEDQYPADAWFESNVVNKGKFYL